MDERHTSTCEEQEAVGWHDRTDHILVRSIISMAMQRLCCPRLDAGWMETTVLGCGVDQNAALSAVDTEQHVLVSCRLKHSLLPQSLTRPPGQSSFVQLTSETSSALIASIPSDLLLRFLEPDQVAAVRVGPNCENRATRSSEVGTFWEQWIFYSGDHGAWGWMVSPRANISTNWPMRLKRVSGFLVFPIL